MFILFSKAFILFGTLFKPRLNDSNSVHESHGSLKSDGVLFSSSRWFQPCLVLSSTFTVLSLVQYHSGPVSHSFG